jgi:hypothetical protein
MNISPILSAFIAKLEDESNDITKRLFSGDFSDSGSFPLITEKFISNDSELFENIIPALLSDLTNTSLAQEILSFERSQLNAKIERLYSEAIKRPEVEKWNLALASRDESALKKLSYESLREESELTFNSVLLTIAGAENCTERQNSENYFHATLLKKIQDKINSEKNTDKTYNKPNLRMTDIYYYYKNLGIDITSTDKQYEKYGLYSVTENTEILSGLPARIMDRARAAQFFIDTPEHILDMFICAKKELLIDKLSFLITPDMILETKEKIFFFMEGIPKTLPETVKGFLEDEFESATCEIVKTAKAKTTILNIPPASKYFRHDSDSVIWCYSNDKTLQFEEICKNPIILDDCVITQLIHLEYKLEDDTIKIAHLDHEYIFYTYEEFDKRRSNIDQKGGAKKRIKTFKIDDSSIPLILNDGTFFLYTVIDAYFSEAYLIRDFFLSIMSFLEPKPSISSSANEADDTIQNSRLAPSRS